MSWSYRVVKYLDGSGFGLHEVFYDDKGRPSCMTERPIGFSVGPDEDDGGPDQIGLDLVNALQDVRNLKVLEEPARWPGEMPAVQG